MVQGPPAPILKWAISIKLLSWIQVKESAGFEPPSWIHSVKSQSQTGEGGGGSRGGPGGQWIHRVKPLATQSAGFKSLAFSHKAE